MEKNVEELFEKMASDMKKMLSKMFPDVEWKSHIREGQVFIEAVEPDRQEYSEAVGKSGRKKRKQRYSARRFLGPHPEIEKRVKEIITENVMDFLRNFDILGGAGDKK
ncbi:MAG: hypothetical protein LUI04_07270 [Porphyromonadaceae bacterium]|nr:hypothetical protein [Porphyromonadaceae bacterium]